MNEREVRPATRVGDVVIFEGGYSRKLSKQELRRLDVGETVTVDPRSAHWTEPIGGLSGP